MITGVWHGRYRFVGDEQIIVLNQELSHLQAGK